MTVIGSRAVPAPVPRRRCDEILPAYEALLVVAVDPDS